MSEFSDWMREQGQQVQEQELNFKPLPKVERGSRRSRESAVRLSIARHRSGSARRKFPELMISVAKSQVPHWEVGTRLAAGIDARAGVLELRPLPVMRRHEAAACVSSHSVHRLKTFLRLAVVEEALGVDLENVENQDVEWSVSGPSWLRVHFPASWLSRGGEAE